MTPAAINAREVSGSESVRRLGTVADGWLYCADFRVGDALYLCPSVALVRVTHQEIDQPLGIEGVLCRASVEAGLSCLHCDRLASFLCEHFDLLGECAVQAAIDRSWFLSRLGGLYQNYEATAGIALSGHDLNRDVR